jgi:AraC-like DNA-binding protein
MRELSGRFTPLDELSSALSRRLSSALEAPDPIAAVEEALLPTNGNREPGCDHVVIEALRRLSAAPDSFRVEAVARELGVSARQLERRFSAAVGLSPKVFSRIRRFNRIFRYLEIPHPNWAQTAAECGYYDQAHLIHDCRSLAGTTPRVLLAEDGDLARHFYGKSGVSPLYNRPSAPSA